MSYSRFVNMDEAMQDIQAELAARFPNLSVDLEFREEKTPVLFIYRSRNFKKSTRSWEHLMSPFHVMVSAVVSENGQLYLSFELCSYHGKVLMSDVKPAEKFDKFEPILDLSESSYQVCAGLPVTKIQNLTFEQLKHQETRPITSTQTKAL